MTSNLVRDLEADYGEDNGISILWTRPEYPKDGKPYTELTWAFNPLHCGFGLEVERLVAGYSDPHRLFVSLLLGPWSLTYHREWPGDREEFLAWRERREQLEESR